MLEIRDATLSDAEQILKIYDYYVKNTAISTHPAWKNSSRVWTTLCKSTRTLLP